MHVLIYSFFICLVIGVVGVFPVRFGTVPVYFIDILAAVSLIYVSAERRFWGGFHPMDIGIAKTWMIFTAIAAVSLFLTPVSLSMGERFISSLYLLRWIAYTSLFFLARKAGSMTVLSGLRIASLVLALLGWIQYALYPDLRNLEYLGWDPHWQRIFATYLDPNYFGLLLVLSIIVWGVSWRGSLIGGVLFLFITLLFTYSRSSYLALAIAMTAYSFFTRRWLVLVALIALFVIVAFFIPQPTGEGGRLFRVFTLEARMENWRTGIEIVKDHPLLGVGFNTLRYAKKNYASVTPDASMSNSGAGLDNSFLFVAATTGILGLASFFLFIYALFRQADLLGKTTLIAVLIHSLFQNSFFFPWSMAWIWMVVGMRDYGE